MGSIENWMYIEDLEGVGNIGGSGNTHHRWDRALASRGIEHHWSMLETSQKASA